MQGVTTKKAVPAAQLLQEHTPATAEPEQKAPPRYRAHTYTLCLGWDDSSPDKIRGQRPLRGRDVNAGSVSYTQLTLPTSDLV